MKVLFVCTGNTCRSPMAAALLLRAAREAGLALEVTSAGTAANPGLPATDHAVAVMKERGEDLSAHRARLVTPAMLEAQDLVLTMTRRHAEELKQLSPEASDKVFTLSDYVGSDRKDIPDPFFGPLHEYRVTADVLEELVKTLVARLADQTGGTGR